MTDKPQRKAAAQKKGLQPVDYEAVQSEIARLSKSLDSSLALRNLSANMSGTARLADAVKNIYTSSPAWVDLVKALDWSKSLSLQSEALRAMDLSSTIQRQTEALRALNWDVGRLQNELPKTLQVTSDSDIDDGLESEIRQLREEIERKSAILIAGEANQKELQARISELDSSLEQLHQRERLAFLLNQVHPAAQSLLEADHSFRNQFLESKECTGFVVSMDIRRSTELMLKARKPEQYADFVSKLSRQLTQEVLESFGVFDKFTGDGILAFFPEFYSGQDAGFHAISSAIRCHQIFREHYRMHRSSFISVLQDTGLGIGIDYGKLHLVQVSGALTVVGPPVVYACRLGGAPAGQTLLNQPAYEVLSEAYGPYLNFEETSHDLKHEGMILAYHVKPTPKTFESRPPDWFRADTINDEPKNN